MQLIEIVTVFDCTCTGTTSHRKLQDAPIVNKVGTSISTVDEWNFSRNQQRNWETILQCVGLKTQAIDITVPVCKNLGKNKYWKLSFCVEQPDIFNDGEDELGLLKNDMHGVPMIVGLTEHYKEGFLFPYLITHGAKSNIKFKAVTLE